jgi:hypothetical protein
MMPEPVPFKPEGPQPLLREVPNGEPFPVAALGPLAEAVKAVRGMTLAPVAIPAASALAVASLRCVCAGRRLEVCRQRGAIRPSAPREWVGIRGAVVQ